MPDAIRSDRLLLLPASALAGSMEEMTMTRPFHRIEAELLTALSHTSRRGIAALCAEYVAAYEASERPTLESLTPVTLEDGIHCEYEIDANH